MATMRNEMIDYQTCPAGWATAGYDPSLQVPAADDRMAVQIREALRDHVAAQLVRT